MSKAKRISTHKIETDSKDYIRSRIDSFYKNGDTLYRDISERDYGVDGFIELFENGIPTGKIAFAQIKGTKKSIVPLKRTPDFISCKITSSNAYYAFQNNIPVILIYAYIKGDKGFYFLELNKLIQEISEEQLEQQCISVKIPIKNHIRNCDSMENLFNIIRGFYDKEK